MIPFPARMVLATLFVWSGTLVPTPAEAQPGEAIAIFSPDWMPLIAVGYHGEQSWQSGATSDLFVLEVGKHYPAHGLSASLLIPTFASGSTTSRVRLALGIGVGVDYTSHSFDVRPLPAPYVPGAPPRPNITLRVPAVQVHAQVGLILRAAPRGRGFLGSLLWLPGVRHRRQIYSQMGSVRPIVDRVRTAARARLTLGWVHDHLHLAAYVGLALWNASDAFHLFDEERVLEHGLQVGVGW